MGKKAIDETGRKKIGNINDPNFILSGTKDSLQESPVDFRNPKRTLIGNINDDDFLLTDFEKDQEAWEKLGEARGKGAHPLDKGAYEPISEEEQSQPGERIKVKPEDAQTRIGLIDLEIKNLEQQERDTKVKLQKEMTLRGLVGLDPDRKEDKDYMQGLVSRIGELKTERQKKVDELIDTEDIDIQIASLQSELQTITEKKNILAQDQGYSIPTSYGIPSNLARRTTTDPATFGELDERQATIDSEISRLEGQRKSLEYAATPMKQETKRDIIVNTGTISGNVKDYDVTNAYNYDQINRAVNEFMSDGYTDLAKKHIESQKKRGDYQGMMSMENLIHGEDISLSEEENGLVNNVFKSVSQTDEYQNADFIKRRSLVNTALKARIAETVEDPEQRKSLEEKLTRPMARNMFLTEDGSNVSLNGVQMFAEYTHRDLTDRKIDLDSQYEVVYRADMAHPAFDWAERKRFEDAYGKENVGLYIEKLKDERKFLNDALEFNEKVLKMNPTESQFRRWSRNETINDFQTALSSGSAKHLLTAGITEMSQALRVSDIAERAATGEVTWSENKVLEMYGLLNMANASPELSSAYKVGQSVQQMIPYVMSFVATNPFYALGKTTTKAALKQAPKLLGSKVKNSVVNATVHKLSPRMAKIYGKATFTAPELAAANLSRLGGAGIQTLANQQMIQKNIAVNTMPNIQVTFQPEYNGMYAKLEAKTPEELKKGKKEAYYEAFAEIFTERMGAYIMKGFKVPGAMINPEGAAKRYMLSKYIGVKAAKSPGKPASNFIRKGMGWDGIAEEYYEELANYFMVRGLKGETQQDPNFFKQQLETLATVAIFGMAMKGANVPERYQELVYGDNVKYSWRDSKGKKQKVLLDKALNTKLREIFEGEDYAEPIQALLEEHKDELSEKQIAFIIGLTGQKMVDKVVEQVNTAGAAKEVKKEAPEKKDELAEMAEAATEGEIQPAKTVTTEGVTEPDGGIEVNKGEQKEIDAHNKKIAEAHPDLAEAGLLIQLPGGQLEVPTYEQLLEHVENISADLSQLTERDEFGQMVISHPEAALMLKQLGVLNKEINRRADTEGVPFKYQLPTEKHDKLYTELEEGQKVKGKVYQKEGNRFRLQLTDGRSVIIFGATAKEASEKLKEIVSKKRVVSLKPVAKDRKKPRINQRTKEVYGNKIAVMYAGKEVAIVEDSNHEVLSELQQKSQELNDVMASEWKNFRRYTKGNMYSGIPVPTDPRAYQALDRMVRSFLKKGVTDVRIVIQKIKNFIRRKDDLTIDQKQYWLTFIDANIDKIKKTFEEYYEEEGLQFDPEAFDITFENPEAAFLSGAQKLMANLRTFRPVWKEVARVAETSQSAVERRFYEIAKMEEFDSVTDENSFQAFLGSLEVDDILTSNLVLLLSQRSFPEVISMFNFYRNVQLTRQYGMIIEKDEKIKVELLNPANKFQEFLDSYHETVQNYKFFDERTGKSYTGYDAVKRRLSFHRSNGIALQNTIEDMTLEERTAARKDMFEEDLKVLSDITGIDVETWRQYFKPQTRETIASTKQGSTSKTEFATYQEMLEVDTFIGIYPKVHSTILGVLMIKSAKTKNLDLFKEMLDKYFSTGETVGGRQITANLYKLSTAIEDRESIGMSGTDIKGDRINSFKQTSHVLAEAERQGREVIELNGIHNKDRNPDKKGTPSSKMSIHDIWFSLVHMYLNGANTYFQHMGQFGDKNSLLLIDSEKRKPTAEDYEVMRKQFTDFNQAAEWMYKNIIVPNFGSFIYQEEGRIAGPGSSIEGETRNEKGKRLAMEFTYNYAINIQNINNEFHGNPSQYKDGLVGLMKRGGSTNSPGYRLNNNIENGVGKTYRTLIISDEILGGREIADGLSIGSPGFFERVAVSMGSIYNKLQGNQFLTSFKGLHSNLKDGNRGLNKVNTINIEVFDMKYEGSKFEVLKKIMKDHNIDMITFTSGNKHTEDPTKEPADVFDALGNVKEKFTISEENIIERNTEDLYIQQDLRHDTSPKEAKMPSQLLSNMFFLPNGIEVARAVFQFQHQTIKQFEDMLNRESSDKLRMEWVRQNVDPLLHEDLFRMIKAGVGFNEPSIRSMLRNILANHVSRNVMEIAINRVTAQEVPDLDNFLEGRRVITQEDGTQRVILPEIMANIGGARAHYHKFEGKPDEAIKYVKKNKRKYSDLYDQDGNLMEWEITERNGVIPGEPVISTRVPADDLHSHTVARLAINLPFGNITMLDQESQRNSGSDFDGDARYNQVLFRSDQGNIIEGNTRYGLSNQMTMQIVYGYMNPEMTDKILTPIDTNAYESIVKRLRAQMQKLNDLDPRAYMRGWEQNKVGVDMKGILSDINTLFNIASMYQIQLSDDIFVPFGPGKGKKLTGFVNDRHGQIKRHITNLLNMAFDNAKDPQIEMMGLNEVTVNMWMLSIMTDPSLEVKEGMTPEEHYELVFKAIDAQVNYFTSPLMRDFTSLARKHNGGLVRKDAKAMWKALEEDHNKEDVAALKKFYTQAQDLPEIRRLYRFTQTVPNSVDELQSAQGMLKKFYYNQYKLFDSGNFFFKGKNSPEWKMEFRIVPKMLDFMQNRIFYDAVEFSNIGREINRYIATRLTSAKAQKYGHLYTLQDSQLQSISYLLNNIVAIRALNPDKPFYQVQNEVIEAFNILDIKKDNKFLNKLKVIDGKYGQSLEVIQEFKFTDFDEKILKEIHEDYDKLPAEFKIKLKKYVFHQFGTSSSRFNGSFYSLMSDKQKVIISNQVQQEIEDWMDGKLTPEEQFNIANFIINASNDPKIKELWAEGQYSALNYDINVAATGTNIPLDYDALEAVESAHDKESTTAWTKEYGFPGLRETVERGFRRKISFTRDFLPWAKKVVEWRKENSRFFVRQDQQSTPEDVHNMLAVDAVGEALMTEDSAIQNHIFERLSELYPDVVFFTDKQAFFDFVRKNGGRLRNVSMTAIGHAFGNAIWIDPEKAAQSSTLHEYAHVYWDALPADHYVKTQLMRLFRNDPKFAGLPEDQIEEQIIIAIGRSAFNLAETGFSGTFLDKFTSLLKKFWRVIKQFFGVHSQQELVDTMAESLWNNQAKINPQTITGQTVMKNMARPDMDPFFDENKEMYIVGQEYYHRTSMLARYAEEKPFDAQEKAEEIITRQDADYYAEHGNHMPIEIYTQRVLDLKAKWQAEKEAGQAIQAVARQVFNGPEVDPSFIKANFASNEAHANLVSSLQKFREAILKKYPNAEFETGVITYSQKHRIAGEISLRIKVGENEYVIVNFKTTKRPFKDSEGKLTESYTRSYGPMKKPFKEGTPASEQIRNWVQAVSYAFMEESRGNKVVEVMVVPIMRYTNEQGKVASSGVASMAENIWDNIVKMPWRDSSGNLAEDKKRLIGQLMTNYNNNRKRNTIPNRANKDALVANGVDPRVANDMTAAEKYFEGLYKLIDIGYVDVEKIAGLGLSKVLSNLMNPEMGWLRSDIIGPKAVEMKYLLFIASEGVTKEEWEAALAEEEKTGRNRFIDNVDVSDKFKTISNPVRESGKGPTRYHLRVGAQDLFVEESGYATIKVGDEIAQIAKNVDSKGKVTYNAYYYTVSEVNEDRKEIVTVNQTTGETVIMSSIDPKAGTMKVIEEDSSIVRDNYEPLYIREKIPEMRRVWKRLVRKDFMDNRGNVNEAAYNDYLDQVRLIDRFFDKNKTVEQVRKALDDHAKMESFYAKLRKSDDKQLTAFQQLVGGSLTANYIAEQIRYEVEHMEANEIKPAILNIYYLLTTDNKSSMFNFGPGTFSKFMTQRMFSGKYIPLHFIIAGTGHAYKEAMEAQIALRNAMEPLFDKIQPDNIVQMLGDTEYYKVPTAPGLSKEERDFLNIIYEHYYKYDPYYKTLSTTGGYVKPIRVSQLFATKAEMKGHFEGYGSIMSKLLKPTEYDTVEIDEVEVTKSGRFIPTGRKITLRMAKEQFSFKNGNDHHNRKWLGTKWRHYVSILPLFKRVNPGLLKYYDRQAQRIYDNKQTADPKILRSRSTIPVAGRGWVKYKSNFRNEAEAKAIEGLIFDHFMKPLLAPMDEVMAMTQGMTNVTEWIKGYTDFIIFKQRPGDVSRGTREFIDSLIRLNSLNKIAWQFKVQLKNFLIGVGMNITREPIAYAKGINNVAKALFSFNAENDLRKVVNIMKKTNMVVHIADDARFDKLDRMLNAGKTSKKSGKTLPLWDRMIDSGYKPMEFFENVIQIPLAMGLITPEELAAYDIHGNIIDPANAINRTRRNLIETRLKAVHGDYGPINANPFWFTAFGAALMQFRKWAPTMFYKEFAAYHIDSNYQVKSGILTSLKFLTQAIQWNTKSEQKKQEQLNEIIKQYESKDQLDQTFFNSSGEYLDRLIMDMNGGKVKLKDMSENERHNFAAAIAQVVMFIGVTLTKMLLVGDPDDDDPFKEEKEGLVARFWMRFMLRYNSDLYFFLSTEQWQYTVENMFPIVSLGVNAIKFAREFIGWAYGFIDGTEIDLEGEDKSVVIHSTNQTYDRDSRYALEGWPKWMVSITHLIPVGSQLRSMMETSFFAYERIPRYDVYDLMKERGSSDEEIKEIVEEIGKDKLSIYDIASNSAAYQAFNTMQTEGGEWLGIKAELERRGKKSTAKKIQNIINAQDYEGDLSRWEQELGEAISWMSLKQAVDNGDLTDEEIADLELVIDAYEERLKADPGALRKKSAERNYEKTKEIIEEE